MRMLAILLLVLLALGAFVAWPWFASAPPVTPGVTADRALVARREMRPTLDPALFRGKAAEAYRVAREMPDVLDQLRCYCACGSEYGHVSLLSCYVDGHGST